MDVDKLLDIIQRNASDHINSRDMERIANAINNDVIKPLEDRLKWAEPRANRQYQESMDDAHMRGEM